MLPLSNKDGLLCPGEAPGALLSLLAGEFPYVSTAEGCNPCNDLHKHRMFLPWQQLTARDKPPCQPTKKEQSTDHSDTFNNHRNPKELAWTLSRE